MHNHDPKSFKWMKAADDILSAFKRFRLRASHSYTMNLSSKWQGLRHRHEVGFGVLRRGSAGTCSWRFPGAMTSISPGKGPAHSPRTRSRKFAGAPCPPGPIKVLTNPYEII